MLFEFLLLTDDAPEQLLANMLSVDFSRFSYYMFLEVIDLGFAIDYSYDYCLSEVTISILFWMLSNGLVILWEKGD